MCVRLQRLCLLCSATPITPCRLCPAQNYRFEMARSCLTVNDKAMLVKYNDLLRMLLQPGASKGSWLHVISLQPFLALEYNRFLTDCSLKTPCACCWHHLSHTPIQYAFQSYCRGEPQRNCHCRKLALPELWGHNLLSISLSSSDASSSADADCPYVC